VLLTVDPDKDFVNVEGVAVASVLPLQSPSVECPEVDAPKADCFSADGDASLGKQILNISMAQIEAIV
jgi:hypothetical protein